MTPQPAETEAGLSPLQVMLLYEIASGRSEETIAEERLLSRAAIRQAITAAQRQLRAKTRLDMMVKAFRGGWIS